MGQRIEKFKNHVKEHKTEYCCVITAVVFTGITYVIMRSNIARGAMGERSALGAVTNTASLNFCNNPTVNLTTVIQREGRGHPGWPVRNIETKRIDLSQRAAADYFGIPEKILSGHLNGRLPDADGLHFERISLGE